MGKVDVMEETSMTVGAGKIPVLTCDNGTTKFNPPKANCWPMLSWERTRRIEILAAYEKNEFGKPGEVGELPSFVWRLHPTEFRAPVFFLLVNGDPEKLSAEQWPLPTIHRRHYSSVAMDVSKWKDTATRAAAARLALDKLRRDARIPLDKVIVVGEGESASAALWAFANDQGFAGAAVKNEAAKQPLDRAALFAACAPRPCEVGVDVALDWAESYFKELVEASFAYPLYGITGLDIDVWPGKVDYVNFGGKIGYHGLEGGVRGIVRTDWMRWIDYYNWQGVRGLRVNPDAPPYPGVPDPLMAGGKKVTTAAEWEKTARPQIMEFFGSQIYGQPPAPVPGTTFTLESEEPIFDGLGTRRTVKIGVPGPEGLCTFHIYADVPACAKTKPVPAFVWISCSQGSMRKDDTRLALLKRGFALVQYSIWEYARDYIEFDPGRKDWWHRDVYACFEKPGARKGESWGAISAWSWGASRALDWIETQPDFDAKHVGVSGLSRGGKCTLWTGARDPRFAMVCPCCSGCMGPRLNRIDNPTREPFWLLQRIQHFWFAPNAKKWTDLEDEMPYDMNGLAACVAPRLLVVTDGVYDQSSGPYAGFHTARLASPVWALYGLKGIPADARVPEPNGIAGDKDGGVFFNYHHAGHDTLVYDWERFMDLAEARGWK